MFSPPKETFRRRKKFYKVPSPDHQTPPKGSLSIIDYQLDRSSVHSQHIGDSHGNPTSIRPFRSSFRAGLLVVVGIRLQGWRLLLPILPVPHIHIRLLPLRNQLRRPQGRVKRSMNVRNLHIGPRVIGPIRQSGAQHRSGSSDSRE